MWEFLTGIIYYLTSPPQILRIPEVHLERKGLAFPAACLHCLLSLIFFITHSLASKGPYYNPNNVVRVVQRGTCMIQHGSYTGHPYCTARHCTVRVPIRVIPGLRPWSHAYIGTPDKGSIKGRHSHFTFTPPQPTKGRYTQTDTCLKTRHTPLILLPRYLAR